MNFLNQLLMENFKFAFRNFYLTCTATNQLLLFIYVWFCPLFSSEQLLHIDFFLRGSFSLVFFFRSVCEWEIGVHVIE